MSKPWDNEKTLIVDAVNTSDDLEAVARDLERRLRHAEGLLRENKQWGEKGSAWVRVEQFEAWANRRDAYLAAAEREDA